MLLANAFSEYKANFKTALVFALLLVFAPIAFFLGNAVISSGTIFFDYKLSLAEPLQLLFSLVFAFFYILLYSFFVSIIIFSVRKDLSVLHFNYYLSDMIHKFAWKTFVFFLVFFLALFLLATALFFLNVPAVFVALLLLVVSSALLFVPQAIVVDEASLRHSVYNNFEFISKNFSSFAYVFITAMVLLAIAQIIEFALDSFVSIGGYASLLFSLVFIVPFIEILKTYLYLLKYDLIKNPDLLHRKKKQFRA